MSHCDPLYYHAAAQVTKHLKTEADGGRILTAAGSGATEGIAVARLITPGGSGGRETAPEVVGRFIPTRDD